MTTRITNWSEMGVPLTIIVNPETIRRLVGGVFDGTYGYTIEDNGQRIVYEGMWVARRTTDNKFVPFSEAGLYGTGSDTAVGVLDERLDTTNFKEWGVTPIYEGEIHQRFTYVWGGALNTTPSSLATDLPDIHLKPEVT